MLKIKFKQYGVFKKQLNSSLNSLSKFFYINDAGRIQDALATNKNAEKKPIANNNLNNQIKFSDPKIRILNNRRAQNFLKEDEESFRKKQEFLEKEKVEKSDLEEEINLEDEDSFLNHAQANAANKNMKLKIKDLTEKSYLGNVNESSTKEIAFKEKNVAFNNREVEKKFELEQNFKSNNNISIFFENDKNYYL